MRFGDVREAIHYAFNYQLMTPESDLEKLWCRVQFTAKGASGATWLGIEMGNLLSPFNHLPHWSQNWIRVAYAGDGHYTSDQLDSLAIYALFNSSIKNKFLDLISDTSEKGQRRREEMVKVARMAVEDCALRDVVGRSKYLPADYCRKVDSHHSAYERRLKRIVECVSGVLAVLADESIEPFEEKLRSAG